MCVKYSFVWTGKTWGSDSFSKIEGKHWILCHFWGWKSVKGSTNSEAHSTHPRRNLVWQMGWGTAERLWESARWEVSQPHNPTWWEMRILPLKPGSISLLLPHPLPGLLTDVKRESGTYKKIWSLPTASVKVTCKRGSWMVSLKAN